MKGPGVLVGLAVLDGEAVAEGEAGAEGTTGVPPGLGLGPDTGDMTGLAGVGTVEDVLKGGTKPGHLPQIICTAQYSLDNTPTGQRNKSWKLTSKMVVH